MISEKIPSSDRKSARLRAYLSQLHHRSNPCCHSRVRGLLTGLVFLSLRIWALLGLVQDQQAAESTTTLPTLNRAKQILNLPREQAERHYPVRLRGVVTFFDARSSLCFVQDDSAGIYIYQPDIPLQTGQLIELMGRTAGGGFAPIIYNPSIRVLGRGTIPAPLVVSLEDLATGNQDSQWVEITGVVHRVEENWGHLVLDIYSRSSRLKARVFQIARTAETNLVDARVRVRGVAGTHYNEKGQLTGFHLLVPSTGNVAVIEPPPPDPFRLPVQTGRSLLSYAGPGASDHRIRLKGTVMLHQPGESLFVRDATGGIRVQTDTPSRLEEGDVIEVVGFPARGGYSPVLVDAQYRRIASGSPLTPVRIGIEQALSGTYNNEFVEINAHLLHLGRDTPKSYRLTLQAGDTVFHARLVESSTRDLFASVREGSQVRLWGVCMVGIDANAKPAGFDLWLRSAKDLAVLSPPPWWTSARVFWAICLAFAALVGGLFWLYSLRRQVRLQTELVCRREAALEERYQDLFENANDLIFSHHLDGNITSLNRASERVTGYSETEAKQMNIYQIVAPAYQTLARLKIREKIAGLPRATYEMEMIAKDGRRVFVEVNSRLSYKDGKPTGVIAIARDITERKETEQALRFSERQLRQSLEERVRLGRDLHDGFIQSIYVAGLALEDCRQLLHMPQHVVNQRLMQCIADLNATIREVRNFIMRLELNESDVEDLPIALRRLVEMMNDRQSVVRFNLQIDPRAIERLKPRQTHELLQIAREAMSNSLRHAQAQQCILSLSIEQSRIKFEVLDDGVGFDRANPSYQGHGLLNMAARARDLSAHFEIISFPGSGTRVLLELTDDSEHAYPQE